MSAPKRQNYLNNRDILKEIHASKMSFCWLLSDQYYQFDIIVDNINEITPKIIAQAQENQAKRIQQEQYAEAMTASDPKDYRNKPKQKDFAVEAKDIPVESLTFRVMTYDHIPEDPERKRNPKTQADEHKKLNFPPFKHYAYINGELTEVARSHWRGDLQTGKFSTKHGKITNRLGHMFLKLVERYSHRSNWRGYTYVDEMRGTALVQLSYVGLKFDESKSDNPFAYYTATVNNSFTKVLNLEKRNQTIRDDILIEQGHMPSYTRQLAHETEMREMREAVENADNDGLYDL